MLHGPLEVLTREPGEARPTPIDLVAEGDLDAALTQAGPGARALAAFSEFDAKPGAVLVAPGPAGEVQRILFGLGTESGYRSMSLRPLPTKLPAKDYVIGRRPAWVDPTQAALAWALGSYAFDRYKAQHGKPRPRLVVSEDVDLDEVQRLFHACALARDMVNTPANDMGPLQIETIAREVAHLHGASITCVAGDQLLEAGYPAVHAVGRAAAPHRAPRIVELSWRGSAAGEAAPLVALVGKGVVFDTGGLDIKPSSGMRLMKKDMGGAAHALGLARLVMGADLPVRLAVLLPAVENAISGDAMRPGDVIGSRKGLSIEIGNTDAEGRLILADALARAGELKPELTIDFATLTGAARVALGPEVIPFFTDDEALAADVLAASEAVCDPVWRMPLWRGYEEALSSDVADLKNDPDSWAQAGAVTAALFLKRFAPEQGAWAHFDVFAWNPRNRPGWPSGAETQAIRAVYQMLKARYGQRR